MKIACLGWGSLVWNPRSLQVSRKWFEDGPLLPIEFARESTDRRVTLVITSGSPAVRSLWALSFLHSVDAAKEDLAVREGIKKENVRYSIGVWQCGGQVQGAVESEINLWATRLGLDAVVWTKLKPRFSGQERVATADEVITHLRELAPELRTKAEQYVRRAPTQIDTPYRRRIEDELKWTALGDRERG